MINWKATLAKKCIAHKIQPVIFEREGAVEKITFFCATEPKNEVRANLIQALPNAACEYEFKVSPKPTTLNTLRVLVSSVCGTLGGLDVLKIYLPEENHIRPTEELVQDINETLMLDEFFKEWSIFVGGDERKYTLAQAKAMIRFSLAAEKHNFRDRAIGDDDMMDLKIALETTHDVSIFLASI